MVSGRGRIQFRFKAQVQIDCPIRRQPAVLVNAFDSWDTPGRVLSTNYVLGKANPVIIRDTSGGRTGTMTLLVSEDLTDAGMGGQELDQTMVLLNANDVLLFNPFFNGLGFNPCYFVVTDVSTQRVTTGSLDQFDTSLSSWIYNPARLVYLLNVAFTEVDDPTTNQEGPTIATWQSVKDNFATWGDVKLGRTDWLDVLNRADLP